MRVVGVVDGVPAVAGAAGSRTNKTTPGRARRSRVCTSVMGLSLSSGASATSSGARARAMAIFAVSRSPSLRSKRAGESATQAPDIYDDEDPIATAPPAEAPTTATFRAPERRRVATAVATSAACRLAFSPVGQLELPVQRRSNSRTCVDSPHDPLLREAGRDTKP
jgi:hypothetical protein